MLKQIKNLIFIIIVVTTVMMTCSAATGHILFSVLRLTPENGWRLEPHTVGTISFTASATAVSIVILVYIYNNYFKPIAVLADALDTVAEGDFSAELPVMKKDDEVARMNMNFNKMVRELRSTETLQADFVQNVSHEFKTPIASIRGYAELIADIAGKGGDIGLVNEYAEQILESADRLATLTGNILSLSKLENQHIVSEKTEFSLDEEIRQAYLSLEPLWNSRDLDIEMELPETRYRGNKALMFQIWTNIFSNAVKFTPDGGTIEARIVRDSTRSRLAVVIKDTGIGMSEEEQKHIFERFYQAETNRSKQGNGLGLTLTKKIVELCEGTIEVHSTPGKGTEFTVRLPMT